MCLPKVGRTHRTGEIIAMAFFLSGQISKCFTPGAIAKQLAAVTLVALLLLTPFSPIASVMISSAKADSTLDNCLKSIGAAKTLVSDIEQDLPGITECAGQIADGDILMAAITVILAADAAINGGFHSGTGDQAAQCSNLVNVTIARAIVEGLEALDSTTAGHGVVNTLFVGQEDKVFGYLKSTSGAADLIADLKDIPGFSELMSEITCGCTLVGNTIDLAKDVVRLTEDSVACGQVVGKFFVGVGRAIGSIGYDLGEWIECYGGCQVPGVDSTQQNDANQIVGNAYCSAGLNQFQYSTVTNIDTSGSTTTTSKYSCDCPSDTTTHYLGGDSFDTATSLFCACNDPTEAYSSELHAKVADNTITTSCQACPSGPGKGIGPYGDCTSFVCPAIAGMVGTPDTPGPGGSDWGVCTYRHACADGSVANASTGACDVCAANQAAQYGDGKDPIGFMDQGQLVFYGSAQDAGQCVDCPSGTASVAGSIVCTPLNCPLTQRVDDAAGGHSCVACDHVAQVLDAKVCVDDQGNALYAPQQCAWGTARPVQRGGAGELSPVAYNPADCRPLDCKGTDHPDDDGHQCKHCDAVVNLPMSVFGGNASGAKTVSMPDGSKTISLPGGKSVSLGSIQSSGNGRSVSVTSTTGKIQVVNIGGAAKEKTVAICLDPDNNPADRKPVKLPGPVIYEQPPNLHPTESDLRPGVVVPFGGDPGDNPIINGGGTATSVPAKLPTGPGNRLPPPGGNSSSLPAQGGPSSGNVSTVPAQGSGGTATPTPAQGEPTREPSRKPGESGGTSSALPAEGDGKTRPIGAGPSRTPKGSDSGAFTTETQPAEGNRPLGVGPDRSSKDKGNSGYTTETMPAEGNGPVNAGPSRSSKGKAGGGYTTFTMPAEGDGPSPKNSPQLRETPKLNEGPQLRTTPTLNGTQQLRLAPQLNPPQGARAPTPSNNAPQQPTLNSTPQVRPTPQLNPSQGGRTPPAPLSNAPQPGRMKPTLNGSTTGPTLTPGEHNPSNNPFAR